LDIVLEEGEVICSKCEGEGCTPYLGYQYAQFTCSKCNGEGKTDWITNAMGERPDICWFTGEFEIFKVMAEKLKEDIDRDIIKNICGDYNEGT